MMLGVVNTIANCTILAVCLWAVLNKNVKTDLISTVLLSAVGIYSLIRLESPYLIIDTTVNVLISLFAGWLCFMWYKNRIHNRRKQDKLAPEEDKL